MLTDKQEFIDHHIDAVLKAAGTSIKYYSLQKSIDDMRKAMKDAMVEAYWLIENEGML